MIEQITLRNFKCFQNQVLELKPLSLLAGLNGMGKSSVMQSLLLLRQTHLQNLLWERGQLVLNGDLVRLGTGRDVFFEDASASDRIGISLTWTNGIGAQWLYDYESESNILTASTLVMPSSHFDAESGVSKVRNQSLFTDDFQYLSADRIGPRVAFEMSDANVRQHRQLGRQGEFVAHYLQVFGDDKVANEHIVRSDAQSVILRHQVETWMAEISPGVRINLDPSSAMDLMSMRFSFAGDRDVSNDYRPTNVGFGITYILCVVVAALAASSGALLLIENPEAHLHPRGQAQMGRLLALVAEGGVQVILETHSDHVLNGMRLAVYEGLVRPETVGLFYFSRIGNKLTRVETPHIDRNGRIDQWPDGFFDEWDKSLEALLTAVPTK
jgi:predicted ATPase